MAAPTLAKIVINAWDLAVFCGECREIRPLDALALALAKDEHRLIDSWRFRCRRCGRIGEAWVTAPGNALIGRKRIWPEE